MELKEIKFRLSSYIKRLNCDNFDPKTLIGLPIKFKGEKVGEVTEIDVDADVAYAVLTNSDGVKNIGGLNHGR